jgi:hypothetical protein
MELSKIKTLYETGCLTAKGVIFLAGENGVFGPDALEENFGVSKAGYYRAIKQLEQHGLMKMTRVPGWTYSRESWDGPIMIDKTTQYSVTIANI